MTEMKAWLDELPSDSPDRELLVAGKMARAPADTKARTWNALVLTLGATSATAASTAEASAGTAAAAKSTESIATTAIAAKTTAAASAAGVSLGAAQAVAVKSVVGAAGLSLGLKSVVVGFLVGGGVLGVAKLADREIHRGRELSQANSVTAAVHTPARRAQRASVKNERQDQSALPTGIEQPIAANPEVPIRAALAPAETSTRDLAVVAPRSEVEELGLAAVTATSHLAQSNTKPNAPRSAASGTNAVLSSTEPRASVLTDQARALAHIQRQLDAGATAEAIRRLELSFASDAHYGLAEERDALYVQALMKARRIAEASALAKRFVQRYPNSPHCEKMRHLLNAE
jgi:hypothetical protein